jgi:basic membrane protein A
MTYLMKPMTYLMKRWIGVLLHVTLALGILVAQPFTAAAQQKKAALITYAPVAGSDWDRGHFIGWESMIKKTGMASSLVEGVNFDQAASVLRRLAREGNDLIVASSAGYGRALLDVAPEFPDTFFVMYSSIGSLKGIKNLAEFRLNWNEAGYLSATVACLAKASDRKIGMVLGEPITAFTRFGAGATQAVKDHCPKGEDDLLVSWIRTFTDISRGKQASIALVAQGAEVLFGAVNGAFNGIVGAVKQVNKRGKNAKIVMEYMDRCEVIPEACITSFTFDWIRQYDRLGALFVEGKLEPKTYQIWVKNDGVKLVFPLRNVDSSVEKGMKDVIAKIKAGEINVSPTDQLKP